MQTTPAEGYRNYKATQPLLFFPFKLHFHIVHHNITISCSPNTSAAPIMPAHFPPSLSDWWEPLRARDNFLLFNVYVVTDPFLSMSGAFYVVNTDEHSWCQVLSATIGKKIPKFPWEKSLRMFLQYIKKKKFNMQPYVQNYLRRIYPACKSLLFFLNCLPCKVTWELNVNITCALEQSLCN